MVRKITSLALMLLALLSLQLGPATMARASMNPNMVSPTYSTHQTSLLSGHHLIVSKSAAHHRAMGGQCCVFHTGACDMVLLSERLVLYGGGNGQRVRLSCVAQRLSSFLVPAALRPPIPSFA